MTMLSCLKNRFCLECWAFWGPPPRRRRLSRAELRLRVLLRARGLCVGALWGDVKLFRLPFSGFRPGFGGRRPLMPNGPPEKEHKGQNTQPKSQTFSQNC